MNKSTTFVAVHSITSRLSSLSGAPKYLSRVVLAMMRSLLPVEATSQRDRPALALHLCFSTERLGAFLCPVYLLIILLREFSG